MTILGGASTLTGPIVGTAVITLVKNVASSYVDRWNSLLGLIFVAVIMFMPYGLVPGFKQTWKRLRGGAGAGKQAQGTRAEPPT